MTSRSPQRGFYVQVFLQDGDPDGVKEIEKSNWAGRGLVIPRALFGEARKRDELSQPGVYLLVGPPEVARLPKVYIGEGDPVRLRLERQARDRDFWTHAVVFTRGGSNLNKAHVQHLEARLVELAQATKRCMLENGTIPTTPSLSEADLVGVEGFLDDMLLCLPILGYGFFEHTTTTPRTTIDLILESKGVQARGFESSAGFVVRSGSAAVRDDQVTRSIHAFLSELRGELIRQGVLVETGQAYRFSMDYTFASPSSAAGVILGGSANGRKLWETTDGRTLGEIQDAEASG